VEWRSGSREFQTDRTAIEKASEAKWEEKSLLVLRTKGQMMSSVIWLVDYQRIVREGMEMLLSVLPVAEKTNLRYNTVPKHLTGFIDTLESSF